MRTKEWNPAKAFEISESYWQACTLQASVELGVFEAIGNKDSESQALASQLRADKRAVDILLNALAGNNLTV